MHQPNRLIHESSLYLQQHAYNPVDWYPWCQEALDKAQQEDKPILLSVGYSACHWCHVMAHESFEDPSTAEIMNRLFVNIKVDREERPDLDSLYMSVVVAVTGNGGWPMTVFLFPDGTPFYGGTYFPPEEKSARYGVPSFKQVLQSIADAYAQRRGELRMGGQEIVTHLQRSSMRFGAGSQEEESALSPATLDTAFEELVQHEDSRNGGFGDAPKFPQPMTLEFLLRYHLRTGNDKALGIVEHTLYSMAMGGIYDQLGGGFHRYSVDAQWLVPHFEKVLYNDALLARIYTETYQYTGNPLYRRIAEETLDYIVREMHDTQGGFYSTQDADSEGKEGAFFVWSIGEVRQVLGEDTNVFCQIYHVTPQGNFEGYTILHRPRPLDEVARVTGRSIEQLEALIARCRKRLWEVREQRVKPGRDEKVITAWNGLALRAFAAAAAAFDRADYLQIAQHNAHFLLNTLRQNDGRVLRSWTDGTPAPIVGYLEDYALLIDGLLALHQSDGNLHWLHTALQLADDMVRLFWSDDLGGFYDTASDHEHLVVRPRDVTDNAMPSGNSVAVDVLLRLAALTGNDTYHAYAAQVLGNVQQMMGQAPQAFGRMVCAADFALARVREVALVGDVSTPAMQALMHVVNQAYRPHVVVAMKSTADAGDIALLKGRDMVEGKATAYVCEGFACKLPVTEPETLREQLGN